MAKEAITVAPGTVSTLTDHIYAGAKIVNSHVRDRREVWRRQV